MQHDRTCLDKFILLSWSGPHIFCANDVQALPENLPGVYVLAAFAPMLPVLVPFYVGQSQCLRRRLTEHLVGTRTFAKYLRRRLSTYFAVAAVSDPQPRTAAEASLIRTLSPAGNEVIPIAGSTYVNPPPLSLLDP